MSIQIALLRYFPYKLSSLVAKKIKSKALAADGADVHDVAGALLDHVRHGGAAGEHRASCAEKGPKSTVI